MNCFLCNKNNFEKKYALKHKEIMRCKNDGLFVAEKTMNDKVYGKEYFSNSPNLNNQKYFLNKLNAIKLRTYNLQPKILNVGCGWGDFEEVLEKEKIPYLGIDINKEAVEICRKKGLNCIQSEINDLIKNGWPKLKGSRQRGEFFQIFSGSSTGGKKISDITHFKFDAITMLQVIEHLKNPVSFMQSAKKLLKKNGVILITTPNNESPLRKLMGSRWSVYTESSHYLFFDKNTLGKTLYLAGFKNIKVKLDQIRFLSFKYIVKRLNEMFFNSSFLNLKSKFLDIPIPTDPFGDIEALAENIYR